jgi:hypothetical protein
MGRNLNPRRRSREEKPNLETHKALRDAVACGCRRMKGRSGVPAICFAGAQGSLRIDAPPEDASEQIELAS